MDSIYEFNFYYYYLLLGFDCVFLFSGDLWALDDIKLILILILICLVENAESLV